MTSRGRRVAIGLGVLAGLLFAGRWTVEFLAEQWWAGAVSPAGSLFATRWALLRAGLELGAIGLAVGWFAFHLLIAARLGARAVAGSPREPGATLPLRPVVLRWWALATGGLLGILCGAGTGSWSGTVALALERPRWGLAEPGGTTDVGFFLATLPFLELLQQFALALALLGFVATMMLYAVAGALRVTARQFVLDPGIRLHLAVLGASLAMVLAAGYLLEPWELTAGLRPATGAAHQVLLSSLARVLAGLAIAAAAVTVAWGVRGRMMVAVGAWATFALFALAIRLLAPAAGGSGGAERPVQAVRDVEREAFDLPVITEIAARVAPLDSAGALSPALWNEEMLVPDSGRWLAVDRLATAPGGPRDPVLLLVAAAREGAGLAAYLVPEREVTASGGPLSYAEGRPDPAPGLVPFRQWRSVAVYPGAQDVAVTTQPGGVTGRGWLRRLALSWALQANLFRLGQAEQVTWRTNPSERLRALAPFLEWGAVRPRILDGRLVWVADGYLFGTSFPGVGPVAWRGRSVSYLRAAALGVVEGESGVTRLFLRGEPDPLLSAWANIARGMLEPAEAIPAALAAQLHYPGELFAVQGRILQRPHWGIGVVESPPADSLASGVRRLPFTGADGGRIVALLEAEFRDGADQLRLLRFDSLTTLVEPRLLGRRWERLPFVSQMADSVRAVGSRLQLGRIRLEPSAEGLVAFQSGHAVDSSGRARLTLVNLAFARRLGTGPRTDDAWRNLRGEAAALPQSVGAAGQLREAREWLFRADSAFRRGDLAGFARAFEALRAILDHPPGTAK